jgi:hypothetical protein
MHKCPKCGSPYQKSEPKGLEDVALEGEGGEMDAEDEVLGELVELMQKNAGAKLPSKAPETDEEDEELV